MGNDVMDKLKKKGFMDIQLHQIQLGLSEGLPVEIYAKSEFDWFQMEEIRKGLTKVNEKYKLNLTVDWRVNPDKTWEEV